MLNVHTCRISFTEHTKYWAILSEELREENLNMAAARARSLVIKSTGLEVKRSEIKRQEALQHVEGIQYQPQGFNTNAATKSTSK